MTHEWNRRELLTSLGGALAAAGAARPLAATAAEASAAMGAIAVRRLEPPYAIGADNCLKSKSAGGMTVMQECLARLARGERALSAVVAGIEICELDPEDTSVGYGGLPNGDGVIQLDAAVMEAKSGRAGGVAALEGVRNPSRVALAVADRTDHHLLVGAGAQQFARQLGFTIESDLHTAKSRDAWLEWKRRIDPTRWLDPERKSDAGERAREAMIAARRLDPLHAHGTIHLSAMGAGGDLACSTSTSGLAFKIAGRVGDSPILGAGLFCLDGVGAAGSTGRGEANLATLPCAFIVEELARGAHPKDAAMAALSRIRERNRASRLRLANGDPTFNLQFYVIDTRGRFAGVSMYRDDRGSIARYAVGDANGTALVECDALIERRPEA